MSAWGSSFGACTGGAGEPVLVDTILTTEIVDILSVTASDTEQTSVDIYIGPATSGITDERIELSIDDRSEAIT